MPECPTCDYISDTVRGVSVHHSLVHGSSLIEEETECQNCGETFTYYESEKDGVFCADCADNSWGNENLIHGTGEENNNWKGGKSELVETNCVICNETVTRTRHQADTRDVVCSVSCNSELMRRKNSGDKNPMWKGGYSKGWYNNKKWKVVRDSAKERDGYECQLCGSSEMLDVHHIKPVREFEDYMDAHTIDNVVTLCRSCHRKVEVGGETID